MPYISLLGVDFQIYLLHSHFGAIIATNINFASILVNLVWKLTLMSLIAWVKKWLQIELESSIFHQALLYGIKELKDANLLIKAIPADR